MGDEDFVKGQWEPSREQDFFRRLTKKAGRELEDTGGKTGGLIPPVDFFHPYGYRCILKLNMKFCMVY